MLSETQQINGSSHTIGYNYDADNRKVAITYPDGSVVNRAYTSRDQLSSVSHAGNLIATRSYDPGMRLTNTSFGNGLLESRTYRADNLVTVITTPGINELSYQYDANKRVTEEANPLLPGEALLYGYDSEDRLTSWARGPAAAPQSTQSWNLSLVGDWQSTTRDSETETRSHSPVHEVTSLTRGTQPVTELAHDAKGNLILTHRGQTLTWDPENRLQGASTPGTDNLIRINFQLAGAPVPSGYHADTGALFGDRGNGLTYGWQTDLTSKARDRDTHPDQRFDTLVHMRHLNSGPEGNWKIQLPNGTYRVHLVAGDATYRDQTNHLIIENTNVTDPDPYTGGSTAGTDFDEFTVEVDITDGDLTVRPGPGHYNPKLNFIEITPLSGPLATPAPETASYKYDAFGRRLQKTTGGLTTTFVHDGDQVIAEYESTQLARKYLYGTYIDEPLAMVAPTETLYYHQNRLYNVMAMTNGSGALAERYGYTAYGKRRVLSPSGIELTASAVGNQVGFTGRYHDAETQLTYFRARYQDPELGRFVGRDPIADSVIKRHAQGGQLIRALTSKVSRGMPAISASEFKLWIYEPRGAASGRWLLGDELRLNVPLYLYGEGAPIIFFDPFGLEAEQGAGGAGSDPAGGSHGRSGRGESTWRLYTPSPRDWCGTGWNGPLVPEGMFGVDWSGACRAHDYCYETCGSNRMQCDADLTAGISSSCSWCGVVGSVCGGFVTDKATGWLSWYPGQDAYNSAQSKSCKPVCE